MNGRCSTCPIEADCGYPYKPCDCCNERKFRPLSPEQIAAKTVKCAVIPFPTAPKEPQS